MEKQTPKKKLLFGGAELPRLRVLPVILFSVLCVLTFVLAAPAPVRMDPANPADIAYVFIRLSMLLCAAAGVGCGAFLLIFAPLPVTLTLIPLTGGLSYFLARDVWTAAGAMCFFAAPFLLRRLLEKGMPRTGAVVRLSVCLGAIFLPFYYRSVAVAMGTAVPREILTKLSDGCRTAFSAASLEYMGKVYAYSAQDAALMAELLLVLLPAILVLVCSITAWISHCFAVLLFRVHGMGRLVPPDAGRLKLSRVGAVVFLAACLGSVIFSGSTEIGMAEALSLNLFLILEPPFAAVGVRTLIEFFRQRGGFPLIPVIFALLFCELSLCVLLLAVVGVVSSLRKPKTV